MASKALLKIKLAASIYPKLVAYKLFNKSVPILVTFGITNRCNLKCGYCFASLENREQKDMATEKLLNYIDQFADLGTQQIDLQGGEPTLHPDLGRLIDKVVQRGIQCSIATNGFAVEKYMNSLKKCYSVCVSLDGLPETTNANRGKGAYELAVNALEKMFNNKVNIRIHGVLTYRTTAADIDHLVILAKKFLTNINFVYALDSGFKKTGCDEKNKFPEHIRKLCQYLKQLKEKGEPITSKDGALDQVINWPCAPQSILIEKDMTNEQREKMKQLKIPCCLWGHLACFFNTDDCLYICPRAFDRLGYFVKINNRSIKEAFEELAKRKKCYMCGQMGDLSYSFNFGIDNIKTWLKF